MNRSHRYSDYSLTREQREQIIASYHRWVRDYERYGLKPHYLNFMFNHIPGSADERKAIMKQHVERTHRLLTTRIVRKPSLEDWQHLKPVFLGCPDLPVWKHKKQSMRSFVVNNGLHFNLIALVPPRNRLPKGMTQLPILPKLSRLRTELAEHFEQNESLYVTDYLQRIHVEPISYGTMADYTFKAFKHGRISGDDLLVL